MEFGLPVLTQYQELSLNMVLNPKRQKHGGYHRVRLRQRYRLLRPTEFVPVRLWRFWGWDFRFH